MTITNCLDRIVEIEAGLTVDTPGDYAVTKVYRSFLDPQYALPGPRVFQNEWQMLPIDPARMMSLRELKYAVRIQFIAAEAIADSQNAVLIAEAFWEATLAAFCADVGLAGTATRALLRGAAPTLGLVNRGERFYIGFEAFLDVEIRSRFLWK